MARYSYSRRRYSRRSKKRYGRVYRSKWSKKRSASSTSTKRFFKLRTIKVLTTNATGILGSIQADNYPDNISQYEEYGSITSLFDTFKFCAVKLKFIPTAPNDESTTRSYAPLYICGDPDDDLPLTSPANAIQYENLKVMNLFRPWTYYYKFPTASALINANTNITLKGGYRSATTGVSTGPFRAVKLYANDLNPNTEWGTIIATAYIAAKNRR